MGHDCEMEPDEDDFEVLYPGRSMVAKLKRAWMSKIMVHEKICKTISIHLRSHGAVEKERQRHIRYNPSTIHPFSIARLWWETFMLFICLIQLILVPLDVGFFAFRKAMPIFHSTAFLAVRMTTDLICCVDIGVNSITGYYDESRKEVILDHHRIIMHYLKGKFMFDLVSSFPTHFDLFMDRSHVDFMHRIDILIMQSIASMKYLRYFTFHNLTTKLCNIYGVDFYVRHGVQIVLTLFLFWHILSCTQNFGYVVFNDSTNLRIYKNISTYSAVARSLYVGALLISKCSYGLNEPVKNNQFVMTTLLWFLSQFAQIYLLVRVIEFLRAKRSPKIKYTEMVQQLIEFMRHRQLPMYTQRRMLEYYSFHFQKRYFRENEINATISSQLREEVAMQTCRQLVENVEFFRDLPLNLLVRIVSFLRPEIYLTNDIVVKANSQGSCMFFISTGSVAVYTTSGKEVCHLADGDHFGEIALINPEQMRVATVIAVETCELFRLDRSDFIKAILPYPDLLEKIQKIAADRQEKTSMIEEHYQRETVFKKS